MLRIEAFPRTGGGVTRTLTLGSWRFILPPSRTRWIAALMTLLLLVLFYLALIGGEAGIDNPLLETTTRWQQFILLELRLPRALVAIGAGAALAISGALFQLTSRNVLASPDIIGVNAGASAGIVATLLVWPNFLPVPVGALAGATLVMLLVFAWSGGRGGQRQVFAMVISGIALGALSLAFVNFAVSQVRIEQAQQLAALLSGSLASRHWRDVALIWGALCCVPLLLWLGRMLNYVGLGHQVASTVGIPLRRVLVLSVATALLLATASVLVVGPVAFIALSAPQIARRLVRAQGASLFCTALTGALLLLFSDLMTLLLPTVTRLPVGILTAAVGGIYLMYLLYAEMKGETLCR